MSGLVRLTDSWTSHLPTEQQTCEVHVINMPSRLVSVAIKAPAVRLCCPYDTHCRRDVFFIR